LVEQNVRNTKIKSLSKNSYVLLSLSANKGRLTESLTYKLTFALSLFIR